jgi:hypothetical protein
MPKYRHPNTGSEIETNEADFAANLALQGFVPVDAAPDDAEAPNLGAMTRDELNEYAGSIGVAGAADLPNKAAVVEAIEGARASEASDTPQE